MTEECVVLKALWGAKDRNPLAAAEKGGDLLKVGWWCLRTGGQNVPPDLRLGAGPGTMGNASAQVIPALSQRCVHLCRLWPLSSPSAPQSPPSSVRLLS